MADAGAHDAAIDMSEAHDPDIAQPSFCGGAVCMSGEHCCLTTLRCVPVGALSCVPPPASPPGTCASAADCAAGETCEAVDDHGRLDAHCGGLGRCMALTFSCGGTAGACGCDGRTYANGCDAFAAGVRLVADVPCGRPLHQGSGSCIAQACVHGTCDALMGICSASDL